MAGEKTGAERRVHERFEAELTVDWASGENFLFSYITNISEMGIFVRSDDPPEVGTAIRLRFGLPDDLPLELVGVVTWINPVRSDGTDLNPGMGVQFQDLSASQREAVVQLVKTIAYLQTA
ncbi:MAG: TIGR02266 family protein [Sandaracinaceae bacterium]